MNLGNQLSELFQCIEEANNEMQGIEMTQLLVVRTLNEFVKMRKFVKMFFFSHCM